VKRLLSFLLILTMFLSSCASAESEYQKYTHRFFGTFDTIITLIGFTTTEEEFQKYAALAEAEMTRYHMIFDQYYPYDGVANLYSVNKNAPLKPTAAEPELIDLLLKVQEWQTLYGSSVTFLRKWTMFHIHGKDGGHG